MTYINFNGFTDKMKLVVS